MNMGMVVLQGKTFTIELQSMLGSTPYGWCLAQLPKEMILMGIECAATASGIAPVMQKFHFGVVSAEEEEVEIGFVMASSFNPADMKKECKVPVRIVPSDSDEFVSCRDNANELYGFVCDASKASMPYGYVHGIPDAIIPYGVAYTQEPFVKDAAVKYGYPCGVQDAVMKYGYPCGVQDAGMKYGYPCGVRDAGLKYGYPNC